MLNPVCTGQQHEPECEIGELSDAPILYEILLNAGKGPAYNTVGSITAFAHQEGTPNLDAAGHHAQQRLLHVYHAQRAAIGWGTVNSMRMARLAAAPAPAAFSAGFKRCARMRMDTFCAASLKLASPRTLSTLSLSPSAVIVPTQSHVSHHVSGCRISLSCISHTHTACMPGQL